MSNSLFLFFSFTFCSLLALRRLFWLDRYDLHGPPEILVCTTPLASNKIKVLGVCNHQSWRRANCFLGKHLFFNVVCSLNITLHYFEKRTLRRKSGKKIIWELEEGAHWGQWHILLLPAQYSKIVWRTIRRNQNVLRAGEIHKKFGLKNSRLWLRHRVLL
jgi:hypothetical protein